MSPPPIPEALAHRPLLAGMVVPYITGRGDDGVLRFGLVDGDKQRECLRNWLCAACGLVMREQIAFLVQPWTDAMILPDRVYAKVFEPGLHPVCLAYTAKACSMINGSMTHYRSSHIPSVEPSPGSAARLGAPAERWSEPGYTGSYQVEAVTRKVEGRLIAAFFAKLNQKPLRVRAIEHHPAHPAHSSIDG